MKILIPKALVVASVALSSFTQTALAHQWTQRGQIYVVESGWAADTYSVKLVNDTTSGIYTNPAGCGFPQAGYVTSPTDPGRKLYQDQLREAFELNLPVRLLISGASADCPFSKPRIIDVQFCRATTALGC